MPRRQSAPPASLLALPIELAKPTHSPKQPHSSRTGLTVAIPPHPTLAPTFARRLAALDSPPIGRSPPAPPKVPSPPPSRRSPKANQVAPTPHWRTVRALLGGLPRARSHSLPNSARLPEPKRTISVDSTAFRGSGGAVPDVHFGGNAKP